MPNGMKTVGMGSSVNVSWEDLPQISEAIEEMGFISFLPGTGVFSFPGLSQNPSFFTMVQREPNIHEPLAVALLTHKQFIDQGTGCTPEEFSVLALQAVINALSIMLLKSNTSRGKKPDDDKWPCKVHMGYSSGNHPNDMFGETSARSIFHFDFTSKGTCSRTLSLDARKFGCIHETPFTGDAGDEVVNWIKSFEE